MDLHISAEHVFIACGYTDMRKSIDGLSAIVIQQFRLDPFQPSLFLFCGRRRDRFKALLWQGDGFLLLYKRKKKVGHREEMLAKLPHQKIVVEPETTVCPECGSQLSPVGEEFVRSEVVYIPARVEVKDFYRKSYECRECRKQGQPTMLKAAMPQPVIGALRVGRRQC